MPGEAQFCCRLCDAREFVAVGKTRLGARIFACSGCSVMFLDPQKFAKPAHQQLTPRMGHLIGAKRRRR